MENQAIPMWFIKEIEDIKAKIKKQGVSKNSKDGHYGKFYSLDQLLQLIETHKSKDFTMTFLAFQNTAVSGGLKDGGFVVTAQGMCIFSNGKEQVVFPITGVGGDRNSAEFASGKSVTYSQRFFLKGLLGLAQDDKDAENKASSKEEVLASISRKFKDDDTLYDKIASAWKKKYNVEFDPKVLTFDQLINIDNKI